MNTQQLLKNAREELTNNGWEYNGSIMANKTETKFYGMVFVKGGRTFYLNIETMHNIPQN